MCTGLRVTCASSDWLETISVVYWCDMHDHDLSCDRTNHWTSVARVFIRSGSPRILLLCMFRASSDWMLRTSLGRYCVSSG